MTTVHSNRFHEPSTPVYSIRLSNPSPGKWATHWFNHDDGGAYYGRYFENPERAKEDFAERIAEAFDSCLNCGGKVASTPTSKEANLRVQLGQARERLSDLETVLPNIQKVIAKVVETHDTLWANSTYDSGIGGQVPRSCDADAHEKAIQSLSTYA